MDLLIFDYKTMDMTALKEMHGHLNVIEAVECEILLNFDYYNIGNIETNIIRLNESLICVIVDYSIDCLAGAEGYAEGQDNINWIQSTLVNVNFFVDYLDYISI